MGVGIPTPVHHNMKAKVFVSLKKGVLDPQGEAILKALQSMGQKEVVSVRVGKYFEVELKNCDSPKAKQVLNQVSEKLLANTVIEDFSFQLEE